MMEYVKKKYDINFTIPVATDTNNSETRLAFEKFKAIVEVAFDSVNSKDTLRAELIKVKQFLDEHKGVLDYTQTRQVIRDAYLKRTSDNPYKMIFNNKALGLQHLYTYHNF